MPPLPPVPNAGPVVPWAPVLAVGLLLVLARASSYAVADAWQGHDALASFVGGVRQIGITLLPPLAAILLVQRLGPRRLAARVPWTALALLAGTAIALALRIAWMRSHAGPSFGAEAAASMARSVGSRTLLLGALAAAAIELWRLSDEDDAAARHAAVDQAALEREQAEARLQLLQAQIEPHFLFNTLANVRRLYALDAAQGQAMLDSLVRYLSTALPSLRQSTTPLGQEVELAVAWLQLQQMRMGARLAFRVDVPPALATWPVPPLMLLTLVENAVKHGLQPRARGGCVRLEAREADGVLSVSVIDDGIGLRPGGGGGIGLANVRARLTVMHGAAGSLELCAEPDGGTRATLRLPRPAPPGAA
jgi:signal transduction histidine kinase